MCFDSTLLAPFPSPSTALSADTIDKVDPVQIGDSATAMAIWAYSIAMMDELLPRD